MMTLCVNTKGKLDTIKAAEGHAVALVEMNKYKIDPFVTDTCHRRPDEMCRMPKKNATALTIVRFK